VSNEVAKFLASMAPVAMALGGEVVTPANQTASDIPLVWDGEVVGALRTPPLHGAIDRLVEGVVAEIGADFTSLSREDKQRVVRLLDERGAFTMRRAVDQVADALGVSRITIYNYLNMPR
jgi:HTH domain